MIRARSMIAVARVVAVATVLLFALASQAQQWTPVGPDGGDVRSLALDPRNPDRILLGTSAGQLYVSNDGGGSWARLARLGDRDHYVLDNIAFNSAQPGTIYVAAWSIEHHSGALFRSTDDGKSWQSVPAMQGKSIRALAVAASNPKMLVVGALDGVFRSRDEGVMWERISPEGHPEIKNIESIAIDPRDPEVIYAGTWHLPWKTSDGGRTWQSIKKGVIDDSDVFSIIIDPRDPSVVYASACSGIYKSESAGAQFRKMQGIPSSARRTRVLAQDPSDSKVVYAGTTEGLWRTSDAGKTWKRLTGANVIVNDVLLDARRPERILAATDRSGVLISQNRGQSFLASNRGFAHRQVTALLVDRQDRNVLYAGVINDKEYGGVFMSRDAGASWAQVNDGLAGRDIFSLRQSHQGALIAGTNRGIFILHDGHARWSPLNRVVREIPRKQPKAKRGAKTRPLPPSVVTSELRVRVADLEVLPGKWLAATAHGLFTSTDNGRTWRGGPVLGHREFINAHATEKMLAAITPRSLVTSSDGGATWREAKLPSFVTPLFQVAIGPDSALWLSSRGGAFRSEDGGNTWEHVMAGLAPNDVTSVVYDQEGKRLLATAASGCFESRDSGRTWRRTGNSPWRMRAITLAGARLFATTDFDGVVMHADQLAETPTRTASATGGGTQ